MKESEFEELRKQYWTITEAILLYDSGNHSEYDEDSLNEELDNIHFEICEAASDIARHLINKIDRYGDISKVKMKDKDLDDIKYLNILFDMAWTCKAYSYSPEDFGLTKGYGDGTIDSIGADFCIGRCRRSEYAAFGYREFLQLLEEYGLDTEY